MAALWNRAGRYIIVLFLLSFSFFPHLSQWSLYTILFGRLFVKRFALCYQTVVCPVCLSVMLVYCGQTVGRIKMKLGMQVGLGPGHIVLDGTQLPLPKGGRSPPIFGPCVLQPNGCMDQDATWHGGMPHPRRLCVRRGPRSPLPKEGVEPPPQFLAHFSCGQTA